MTILASSLFAVNVAIVFTSVCAVTVLVLLGPLRKQATQVSPSLMSLLLHAAGAAVSLVENSLSSVRDSLRKTETQSGFLDASIADLKMEMSDINNSMFPSGISSSSSDRTVDIGAELSVKNELPAQLKTPAAEDQSGGEHSPTSPIAQDADSRDAAKKEKTALLDSSVSLQLQSAISRKSRYGEAVHPVEFRKFVLTRVGKLTNDAVRLRFAIPDNKKLDIPVGRHVVVQATINGQVTRRAYTPITRPDSPGFFDLVVKGYEFGKMSSYLQKLSVMDTIEVRGPIGMFNYRINTYRHICLIAAGTGLTPCLQTVTSVLEMPEYESDTTFFTLLYQSRSEKDILLLQELRSLHQKYNKRLTIAFFVSSPLNASWGDRIGQVRGCINETYLKKLKLINPIPDMYCVSGPSGFTSSMESMLRTVDESKSVFVF